MTKRLTIPRKEKAVGLYIHCTACKGEPTDGKCKKKDIGGKPCGEKCKHPEKHTYRVRLHIKGTKNKKKCVTIKTRILSVAVTEAIKLAKQFKDDNTVAAEPIRIFKEPSQDQLSLAARLVSYVNEISPDDNIATNVRKVGMEHLKDIRRCFEFLIECLVEIGLNPETIVPEDIGHDEAVLIVTRLKEIKKNPYSVKRHLDAYTRFYNYLRRFHNWNHANPFAGSWGLEFPELTKETLSLEEFRRILDAIDTAPRSALNGQGRLIKYWHSWLKDAFRLALITGCRNGELVNIKYSDFRLKEHIPHLFAKDRKGSKLRQREVVRRILINEDILDFLKDPKHFALLGTDKYVIDNEENDLSREYASDVFGRSFKYYAREAGITKKVFFKTLRKTYATMIAIRDGKESASKNIGHGDISTTQKHYINELVFQASTQKSERMFGEMIK